MTACARKFSQENFKLSQNWRMHAGVPEKFTFD
jgi:hypothetical protein